MSSLREAVSKNTFPFFGAGSPALGELKGLIIQNLIEFFDIFNNINFFIFFNNINLKKLNTNEAKYYKIYISYFLKVKFYILYL